MKTETTQQQINAAEVSPLNADIILHCRKNVKHYFTAKAKISVAAARNGDPTLRENGVLLHSAYNPAQEAARLIEQAATADKPPLAYIFLAFGLGYLPLALAKAVSASSCAGTGDRGGRPDTAPLVLIEPDPARLALAFRYLDWTPLLAHPGLALLMGASIQTVIGALNQLIPDLSAARVFAQPAQTAHAASYFADITELIRRNTEKQAINQRTLAKYAPLWRRNTQRNLHLLAALPGVDTLFCGQKTEETTEILLHTNPITKLSGIEFAKSSVQLDRQVESYFMSIGGYVERAGIGIVKLERQGAKASIAHGIGREKAVAFKAVPDVIKAGVIIDHQLNWKGRGYDTYVIAAPITIGDTEYIEEVVVEQNKNKKNTFYLHEVEKKEKLQSAFKTGTESSAPGASKLIIAQLLNNVKVKSQKTIKSAIVVAAGPTLEALLPKLAALYTDIEHPTIIAVDTALRSLLAAGIEPDYVVVADAQYWNARHLAGLAAPHAALVTEIAVHPSVFRFPCARILLYDSANPVTGELCAGQPAKGALAAGGSVASVAWDLARILGAADIYLAGLDLAFPRKRTHARGSLFERQSHQRSSRLAPQETAAAAALFSAPTTTARDYAGRPVLTDQRMRLYAWWFESAIAAHPEVRTWTLSDESLAIPGVRVAEEKNQPPSQKSRRRRGKHS